MAQTSEVAFLQNFATERRHLLNRFQSLPSYSLTVWVYWKFWFCQPKNPCDFQLFPFVTQSFEDGKRFTQKSRTPAKKTEKSLYAQGVNFVKVVFPKCKMRELFFPPSMSAMHHDRSYGRNALEGERDNSRVGDLNSRALRQNIFSLFS